eukprot:403366765
MNGKRRGGMKDNKPLGVTKSMLAVRQELQNYGVKDKFQNVLAKDQGRGRFGGQNQQQIPIQDIDENPEALYPPMQVPGRPRGELPMFNALQRLTYTDPKKHDELLKTAECERDLFTRMQASTTFILFNATDDHSGKNELRKQLTTQYVDTLLRTQFQLFPPQLSTIKAYPNQKQKQLDQKNVKGYQSMELTPAQKQRQQKSRLELREHQKQMLLKRLQKQTKVTLNDGEYDKYAIHESGSQDGEYMPGEKVVKRLKVEPVLTPAKIIPKKEEKQTIVEEEEKDVLEEEEEEDVDGVVRRKVKKQEDDEEEEEERDEENEDQQFEQDDYYGEDLGDEYENGGDNDDDEGAGYGSD